MSLRLQLGLEMRFGVPLLVRPIGRGAHTTQHSHSQANNSLLAASVIAATPGWVIFRSMDMA